YTVSLRLRVIDANGLKGEDRRSIGTRHDPSLQAGLPRHYGAEISGAPSYVDLQGRHQLDLVFSTYDGDVHVLRPDGRELPGFPQSMPTPPGQHAVPTPRSPTPHSRDPLRGAWAFPVLAPLRGGHKLDIIIPGWDGKVYAWQPNGRAVPGWPVEVKLPPADFTREIGRAACRDNWSLADVAS